MLLNHVLRVRAVSKDKFPVTPAVRVLREHGVDFESHVYPYQDRGGTAHSSACLGVPEHQMVKTLILEDDTKRPLVALMHGDLEVSLKALARHLGVRGVTKASPEGANRHSGYEVGGTSPFGTRKVMPVFVEGTILTLPRIFINGGKRGYLVSLTPQVLVDVLGPTPLEMASPKKA